MEHNNSGNFDVLKNRLSSQGAELSKLVKAFNEARAEAFGKSTNEIIAKVNVHTEHRCTPIDIAEINDLILIGYDVTLGLKQTPAVSDMLLLYRLVQTDLNYSMEEVSIEDTFLTDENFTRSFNELFTYYQNAKLVKVKRESNRIFIAFQIGQLTTDLKVFRFEIGRNNVVSYMDDQGHHEIYNTAQSDIEWIQTTRNDHITGRHPHINILDTLFVETVGGDLTVKIENNTESGLGIYREDVMDQHQVLSDADIFYAKISEFILLKIRPHREKEFRYLLYNRLKEQVVRLDALGHACKLLPEDHGLIFASGYALATGEMRFFHDHSQTMNFSHTVHSPNGEDVLYVFYDRNEGSYLLYSYSLIEKDVTTPIFNHGFSRFDNGKLMMFRHSETDEATKIHAMRIWQTPYLSQEQYEAQSNTDIPQFYRNSGNADLVRGISDLNTIVQYTQSEESTTSLFEALIGYCTRTTDLYYWLGDAKAAGIREQIQAIINTASDIIDEFAKFQALKSTSEERVRAFAEQQNSLITKIKTTTTDNAADFITLLSELKKLMGVLASLRQERYVNLDALKEYEEALQKEQASLNEKLVEMLQHESAFTPFTTRIDAIYGALEETDRSVDLMKLEEEASVIRDDLMLVNEEVSIIETDDPTKTTRIIDLTTNVISRLNALLATLSNQQKSVRSVEAEAEFSSQFKLLTQSMETALSQIQTPEDADKQQARIMSMVEKLESRFAEFDQFLAEIYAKRNEIVTIFENYKKDQLSQYQRRIDNISKAADISLKSIENRIQNFETIDELNSYFITDPMVTKVRELAGNIRNLKDSVRADGIESKLKSLQDQSLRALRDNQDIFEENGAVIKLGKHRFSVNEKAFDLTLSTHQDQTAFHITGTEFYEPVTDSEFLELEQYAALEVPSESRSLYRGEYLAYSILQSALKQETPDDVTGKLTIEKLLTILQEQKLADLVTKYSATKYREGYLRGVHDFDATKILEQLLPIYRDAGLLRLSQRARMLALILLTDIESDLLQSATLNAQNAELLFTSFGIDSALASERIFWEQKAQAWNPELDPVMTSQIAEYIPAILGSQHKQDQKGSTNQSAKNNNANAIFVSREANELARDFTAFSHHLSLNDAHLSLLARFEQNIVWLRAYCTHHNKPLNFIEEAAGIITLQTLDQYRFQQSQFSLQYEVSGLLGQHETLNQGSITGTLDDFMMRGLHHESVIYPNYIQYLASRNSLIESMNERLNTHELKARPLTSFVRNKLITDSYLHLFGANFAKQMGTLGDQKRTDLMGLLLLISPPGYGKTTLVEYIASKMGLVFIKINCPSLGYEVTSLDPKDAPNATAAREIERLNFGLEMGSNVMLYLDDIQHTNPEFLQKFISLSDGTRRIEGVWNGKPKTYDMRGKKFAIIMAGNPYTESGEAFKVPDMLANRADIYNLGDMLSDQKAIFELSYIENAMTSNSVLAPLATRNLNDLYLLVKEAEGHKINPNDLEHPYSALEINEITGILRHLLTIQEILLKVNQQYILSAATADHYRTEPPFLLQGSYRDMNKLTEKVVSAMTEAELQTLIDDHYLGEAQTLTTGAEENLLKLKELRNTLTPEDKIRWEEIKKRFSRQVELGSEDDPQVQIANQLIAMRGGLQEIGSAIRDSSPIKTPYQKAE
ncbi:DNA repair ATPase [Ignatzschineria sp. LJL83]